MFIHPQQILVPRSQWIVPSVIFNRFHKIPTFWHELTDVIVLVRQLTRHFFIKTRNYLVKIYNPFGDMYIFRSVTKHSVWNRCVFKPSSWLSNICWMQYVRVRSMPSSLRIHFHCVDIVRMTVVAAWYTHVVIELKTKLFFSSEYSSSNRFNRDER